MVYSPLSGAGDKDHWVYSSVNKNCKTGIIDCRDSELTDLSLIPILNGTVDVTEMDSITGDTYTQNYPIARVMLSGNMFPAVPDDYFANVSDTLEIVHLHANPSLTTLPAGLFSGMPHLHTVVAHHSGIDSIPASLFKDSPSLATVWMHSNAITTVAADAFTGVGASLTALWLHINEIAIVEPGTLSGLTGLTELYLHHNFLKEDEFTCALLCDVPTDSDVKAFQNVTDKLFCGTACDVTDGQIGAWVDNKVCGYDMCVSWGLSGARRVDGGLLGLAGAAVLGLGAALVL